VSLLHQSPVAEPVTGWEQNIDPIEPLGALAEYYRAFNSRSIQLMELNTDAGGNITTTGQSMTPIYSRVFKIYSATARPGYERPLSF
jgi:hypothetical protein